jgi:uridine kinase
MLVLLINGASASGKTSLSKKISAALTVIGVSNAVIGMDDYFVERPDDMEHEAFCRQVNLDLPQSLDLSRLNQDIVTLNQKQSIKKPIYSFPTAKYIAYQEVKPCDVLVVEGIFAHYFAQHHLDQAIEPFTINVTTESYLAMLKRRIKRDFIERSSPEEKVKYRERHFVGPGFFRFTASSAVPSDFHVVNTTAQTGAEINALDTALPEIMALIKDRLASPQKANKRSKPQVESLVAKSHLSAQYLVVTRPQSLRFHGVFSGVSTVFQGEYTEEVSDNTSSLLL